MKKRSKSERAWCKRFLRGECCAEYRACDYTELRNQSKGTSPGAEELLNLRMILLLVLATLMGASRACAQAQATETQRPLPIVVPHAGKIQTEERPQQHRFWDKKNDWLFAGVGAA